VPREARAPRPRRPAPLRLDRRREDAGVAKLVLDGFQAGLSWATILNKREAFYRVFEGFDPDRLAAWDEARILAALADPGIVRNRAKVRSTVQNARAFQRFQADRGSFGEFLWSFVGGRSLDGCRQALGDLPAETAESRAMAKALRQAGFNFCGPTICYAFMQAVGMVNDHAAGCFRYGELKSS